MWFRARLISPVSREAGALSPLHFFAPHVLHSLRKYARAAKRLRGEDFEKSAGLGPANRRSPSDRVLHLRTGLFRLARSPSSPRGGRGFGGARDVSDLEVVPQTVLA